MANIMDLFPEKERTIDMAELIDSLDVSNDELTQIIEKVVRRNPDNFFPYFKKVVSEYVKDGCPLSKEGLINKVYEINGKEKTLIDIVDNLFIFECDDIVTAYISHNPEKDIEALKETCVRDAKQKTIKL